MFARTLSVCIYIGFINYLIVSNDAARILAVFPTPSISHQIVFRPLTQELAKRGHELVIMTTDPAFPEGETPQNITEIDVHDLSYEFWVEHFVKKIQGNSDESIKIMATAFHSLVVLFEKQINTKGVQNLIKSKQHFDLIFTEACSRPALVMSHVFKAPIIQFSSLGSIPDNLPIIGAPSHPIYYPEFTRKRIYNLSLWEKIVGAYEDFQLRYILHSLVDIENAMIKRNFGPNVPCVTELSNNVEMLFVNLNHALDGNRPVPPGVIYLGGLHQKPPKELPNDLKYFLDGSKEGVIYMSFGTNVHPSQLPNEKIQIFNKVFSKLPYDILWKWDKDELPGRPPNVRISKWLPQSDLLKHPKIKLFITQGGLQSTDESLLAGVPLIAFPMLADQWFNAEKYVHFNIGMKLEITTVSEDVLTKAINEVIKDKSYRENIKQLNTLLHDKPQTPLERAVWWTEYVIRHGGAKHLRSAAANVSWAEYLMLDVVAVVFGSLIILLAVTFKLLTLIYRSLVADSVKLKTN